MKDDFEHSTGLSEEVSRNCMLTRARRVSRVITGIYDQALRPHGINAPQFSLLVLITRLGGATRAEIGRANAQERSTLSRNLELLLKEGWVVEGQAEGRSRPITISLAGRTVLEQAAPGWRAAQETTRNLLGETGASAILTLGDSVEEHHFA